MRATDLALRFAGVPFVALLLAVPADQVAGMTLERIRATGVATVCADPANLPLSDARLNPPGYDLEIADEIAKSLGAKLQYNWFATAYLARVLRELYEEKCDFMVGLPTDKRLEGSSSRIVLSKPYLTTGFVTVVAQDVQANGLDDLKGKHIGVEMHSVADFRVFGLGHERSLYSSQAALFKALVDREISAAVMWAPMVGWLMKEQSSAQVKVLTESRPELSFPLAVAVRKDDPAFLGAINEAIDSLVLSGRRDQILATYNFPTFLLQSKPSTLLAVGDTPTTTDAARAQQVKRKGYGLYHQACAKCHGRGVISGGIVPDLRRYAGSDQDFFTIVKNGRPGTAMPAWKDLLSDEEIQQIQGYVSSVRTD